MVSLKFSAETFCSTLKLLFDRKSEGKDYFIETLKDAYWDKHKV